MPSASRFSPKTHAIIFVAGIIVAGVPVNWLWGEYINPEIKASFTLDDDRITIENQNRVAWSDPWLMLDDSAEIRMRGRWEPHTKRTLKLTDFRKEGGRSAHDPESKKGFTIMITSADARTTVFYDWSAR